MTHLIFAQALATAVDIAAFGRNAQRYFRATLEVLSPANDAAATPVRVELKGPNGVNGIFSIHTRPRTPDDLARAHIAEQRGRAAGMAALAERCPIVWLVDPEPAVDQTATLMVCAILASVALGPVLPPDDSTLFGVRGAMERVERLQTSAAREPS